MATARRYGAATVVTVVGLAGGACGLGQHHDCTQAGTARVCVTRGSRLEVSATGLEPGSPVVTKLLGRSVDAGPGPPQIDASPDGTFPPEGVRPRIVIPSNSPDVTVTVTVTPRAGSPTTLTFRR